MKRENPAFARFSRTLSGNRQWTVCGLMWVCSLHGQVVLRNPVLWYWYLIKKISKII